MSVCGGVFTFTGLKAKEMSGFLMIAIPSLVAGVAMVWFAIAKLFAGAAKPPES